MDGLTFWRLLAARFIGFTVTWLLATQFSKTVTWRDTRFHVQVLLLRAILFVNFETVLKLQY